MKHCWIQNLRERSLLLEIIFFGGLAEPFPLQHAQTFRLKVFSIGLVNSVLNLPNRLVDLLGGIQNVSSLPFSSDLVRGVHACFARQAKKKERLLIVWGEFKFQKNFNQSCSSKNFYSQWKWLWGLVHASYMLANENLILILRFKRLTKFAEVCFLIAGAAF